MSFRSMRRFMRHGTRGYTMIELVVVMGLLALAMAGIGVQVFAGMAPKQHTSNIRGILGQMNTALGVYQGQNSGYPEDATNLDSTANAGAASYDALLTDLQGAGVYNFPTYANQFATWTYEPINGTVPPTFTILATATGGDNHVICADSRNGVVDLGVGGAPTTPGVRCQ